MKYGVWLITVIHTDFLVVTICCSNVRSNWKKVDTGYSGTLCTVLATFLYFALQFKKHLNIFKWLH